MGFLFKWLKCFFDKFHLFTKGYKNTWKLTTKMGREVENKKLARLLIMASMLFAVGCTSTVNYNQSYEGPLIGAVPQLLEGKALIYASVDDDQYVFSGNPTSLTGAATTLEISLGEITREISKRVFNRIFSEGTEHSNSMSNAADFRVVVNLRTNQFNYAYNQLQNVGLAITPQASVSIDLLLMDNEGVALFRNTYESGIVDGDIYVLSGAPAERINRAAHEAITEVVNRAATDVYYFLSNSGDES